MYARALGEGARTKPGLRGCTLRVGGGRVVHPSFLLFFAAVLPSSAAFKRNAIVSGGLRDGSLWFRGARGVFFGVCGVLFLQRSQVGFSPLWGLGGVVVGRVLLLCSWLLPWDAVWGTGTPFTPWPLHSSHSIPIHPMASPCTPLPPHAPRCLSIDPIRPHTPYKITPCLPKPGDSCPALIQTLQTAWTQHQQAQSCPMLRESSLGSTRYQLEGQHPNINTVFSGFGVVLCFFLTCSKDRRLRGPHNLTGLTMFPRAAFLPAWPTTTRACLYGSPSPRVF